MSYTPDNQNIEDPIDDILKGIKDFQDAARERILNGEWEAEHKQELSEVQKDLIDIELKLNNLK